MNKAVVVLSALLFLTAYAQDDFFDDMTTEEKVTEEKAAEEEVVKEEATVKEPAPVKTPESKTEQEKINIAVLDLQNRGKFSADEIKMITDRINSEVHKTHKFTLIERQQIGDILAEQGFQQSGACTDQDCMVEIGKLLAVNKVIGGSIGMLENIYPVTLKFIDIQTGKVDAQIIRDFKGSKTKLLSEHIPQITHDLMVKAGYIKAEGKEKGLFAKPGFWIPTILVVSGGVAAAIILTQDEGGTAIDELDISDFPSHIIDIPY